MTVKDVVQEMTDSSGFVIFVSFLKRREDGTMGLEHRYMRQQFMPEDLAETFNNFKSLIQNDLKDSGYNLLKSAEGIVNQASPLDEPPPSGNILQK